MAILNILSLFEMHLRFPISVQKCEDDADGPELESWPAALKLEVPVVDDHFNLKLPEGWKYLL